MIGAIDTMVAHHLFDIVKALRLMGTTSIITGIQPEVAQTIVQLGVTLTDKVETMASLRLPFFDYGVAPPSLLFP